MWRAVDDGGEVLRLVVQRQRDTEAALRLLERQQRPCPRALQRLVEPTTIANLGGVYLLEAERVCCVREIRYLI